MSKAKPDSLEIIYHDHHFVVVNKMARIPVGSEDSQDTTLLEMVRKWNSDRQAPGKKGYCVPIHFLDRPVSGAVMFALSSKAASRINEQFRAHQIKKTYIAISETTPSKPEGSLVDWLSKDHAQNISKVVPKDSPDAKKCELKYTLVQTTSKGCLFKVEPITGRSHQIRVQMSHIGCPLIGDMKYGAQKGWDGKVALHALTLEVRHPVSKELMLFHAKTPDYWKEIWDGQLPNKNKDMD